MSQDRTSQEPNVRGTRSRGRKNPCAVPRDVIMREKMTALFIALGVNSRWTFSFKDVDVYVSKRSNEEVAFYVMANVDLQEFTSALIEHVQSRLRNLGTIVCRRGGRSTFWRPRKALVGEVYAEVREPRQSHGVVFVDLSIQYETHDRRGASLVDSRHLRSKTLRPLSCVGSADHPEGLYEGHDLSRADMPTVYAVGRTPREAIEALCLARMGTPLGHLGDTLPEGESRFQWGCRFVVDGTYCKAAGIYVPGGVVLTWWS